MLLRPHYASTTIPLRLYHVLTALVLRPHYAYQDLSTLITLTLRPYRVIRLQHDLTTLLLRLQYVLTTLLLRLQYVLTTTILRTYRDLTTLSVITSTSCSISIQFHSFYFELIHRFLGKIQSCHQNLLEHVGVVVGVDVDAEGALIVTNPDQAEISDRPIQPKLQPFAGP